MSSSKTLTALLILALTALGAAGCGESSSNSTVPEVDTVPPAVPTELASAYATGVVKVSWAPNVVDADFAGFKVYRRVERLGQETIAELIDSPTDATLFVDQNPVAGLAQYRVTAVDQSGNESGYALTTIYIGEGLPPQPITH